MRPPPRSRNVLENESFVEHETHYIFSLPDYYAEIFSNIAPNIYAKLIPTFCDNPYNSAFKLLKPAPKEVRKIEWFIKVFKRVVIIAINKNIKSHFTNELDTCIALEYIYSFERKDKTHYGKAFNRAKYHQHSGSVETLINGLYVIIKNSPYIGQIRDAYVTYVPPYNKKYYLPRILAKGLVAKANRANDGYTLRLISSHLNCPKPNFKSIPVEQKYNAWQEIYKSSVMLAPPIGSNLPVIVIDDNYQSGTTLWSYAKFLKGIGCSEVHGIVCVKLMRDTDNQNHELEE